MSKTIVTRGNQITLTKEVREKTGIREGDVLIMNLVGDTITVTKRNPKAFENRGFLPANFDKVLKDIRKFSWEKRFKRLGIIE